MSADPVRAVSGGNAIRYLAEFASSQEAAINFCNCLTPRVVIPVSWRSRIQIYQAASSPNARLFSECGAFMVWLLYRSRIAVVDDCCGIAHD